MATRGRCAIAAVCAAAQRDDAQQYGPLDAAWQVAQHRSKLVKGEKNRRRDPRMTARNNNGGKTRPAVTTSAAHWTTARPLRLDRYHAS